MGSHLNLNVDKTRLMITTFLLCLIFLGPGFLIGIWLKLDRLRLPYALLYSYTIYLVLLQIVVLMAWPGERVVEFQLALSVILFGVLLYRGDFRRLTSAWRLDRGTLRISVVPSLFVGVATTVWLVLVGPYLEIPTDVFEHLSRITDVREDLKHGAFSADFPWYSAVAIALSYSGESILESIVPLTIAMTTVFLLSIVSLARAIAGSMALSSVGLWVLLVASPVLTVLIFGTSVFSYLRYYVFAPAFLVYLVYLLAGFVVVESVVHPRQSVGLIRSAVTVTLGVLVSYAVHRQEALFITVLAGAAVAYGVIAQLVHSGARKSEGLTEPLDSWSTFGVIGFPVILFVALFLKFNSIEPENSLLVNNIIDVGQVIGLDRQLLIADPLGRAFETLGLGGLLLIAAYFLLIPRGKRSVFLSLSIIMPFLIIFNPIATGIFLSVSKQEVLWRFTYMIPIGLIAGYLLAFLVTQGGARKYFGRNIVVGSALFLSWVPFKDSQDLLQQRYGTLAGISASHDIRLYSDLLEQVDKYSGRDLLTDPVTGYVIGALTQNKYSGFKFHHAGDHIDLNKDQYSADAFSGFTNRIVIVNLRDGAYSENGEISGHWPHSILTTSNYYSGALRDFLATDPPHFKLLWEKDRIWLYEIMNPVSI